MSLRDYLHEKAEESRHNETIGYLIAIIGSIFVIGGILETLIAVEKPHSWFLFFPYNGERFMGDPLQPFRIITRPSRPSAFSLRNNTLRTLCSRKSMVYE